MNNRTIIAIVIIIILIALGILWLAPFDNPEENEEVNTEQSSWPEEARANHFFKDGTHTIEGTITLPTPCHTLVTDVTVNEAKDKAVVNFVGRASTGICAQVVAEKIFTVNFQASGDAEITATFNGAPIRLNLIEGEEGGIEKL